MQKGNSGGFALSGGHGGASGISLPNQTDSVETTFRKIYNKNYRKKEREAKDLGQDIELRKNRLFHNFKKLVNRKEPQLSAGQSLFCFFGTESKDVGRDDQAAKAEAMFVVHTWSTYLKTIRVLQCSYGFAFFFFGMRRLVASVEKLPDGHKDMWMSGPLEDAYFVHIIGDLVVALPCCMTMLFLTFKRDFFWANHQTIMSFGLLLVGFCVVVEIALYVPRIGYGTATMYIMTIFQYQLLPFSRRVAVAFAICLVYFMMVVLLSTNFGDKLYHVGNFSKASYEHSYPLIYKDTKFTYSAFPLLKVPNLRPPYDQWENNWAQVGIDSACRETLQEATWDHFTDYGNDIAAVNNTGDWSTITLLHVFNNFTKVKVEDVLRSKKSSYWQNINPSMACWYFMYLLGYVCLLLPYNLMCDYHERACFNKEMEMRENTKKMNKQRFFEETLLKRLLPPEIVPKLAEKRATNEVVAERFEEVTILFCDMVGFTKFSSELDPSELMVFLSALYAKYSEVLSDNSLYTVEVIGDALLAVAGCPKRIETEDHASRALKAAFELIEVTRELSEKIMIPVNIRVGLHSGSVIAGVVGVKDPRYHLFGEAVKVAEMMESTGEQDKVQCSHKTYENLFHKNDEISVKMRNSLVFSRRVDMPVKAKTKLAGLDYGDCTYFVKQINSAKLTMRRLTLGRGDISPPPNKPEKINVDKGEQTGSSREYKMTGSETRKSNPRRQRS